MTSNQHVLHICSDCLKIKHPEGASGDMHFETFGQTSPVFPHGALCHPVRDVSTLLVMGHVPSPVPGPILSPLSSSPAPPHHRYHSRGAAPVLWGQRLPDGHSAHQQHPEALPGADLHPAGHLHRYELGSSRRSPTDSKPWLLPVLRLSPPV